MRTKEHWQEIYDSLTYHEANRILLQIKDIAKLQGFNSKGIKLFSKKAINDYGYGHAKCLIDWVDGPEGWADDFHPYIKSTACIMPANKRLVFYDS